MYANEFVSDEFYHAITRKNLVKRHIRRDSNQLGLGLITFFVVSILCSLLLSGLYSLAYFYNMSASISVDAYYLLSGAMTFLSLGLPFYLYMIFKKETASSLLKFKPIKFKYALLYVITGWGLCLCANLPVNLIYNFISDVGIDSGMSVNPGTDSVLSFVLKIIAVGVAPAIFEEFVFRGVVLSKLRKYGTSFALIASSLLFAMLHSNLISLPFAFLAGIIIGFIYIKTDNLWIAIAIHFLNNTFSVIQEEVLAVYTGEIAITVFNIIFYVAVSLSFMFFAYLEYKFKLSENLKNEIDFVKMKSKIFALITNPCMILFFILAICSIIANMGV